MLPVDGRRTTLFELDLQLYYVEFEVYGATMSNIKAYRPFMKWGRILRGGFDNGVASLKNVDEYQMEWTPIQDAFVIDAFKERYAPKLVVRRIDP